MVNLRKSSFLEIYRKKGGIFLFSLLTKKIFRINSSWEELINKASKDRLQRKRFIKIGLLTEAGDYEEEINDYFNRKIEANEEKLIVYFTITSKCDLKCCYCFENHIKRSDVDPSDIKLFVGLLEKTLKRNEKIKRVELTLFGGEPLLRADLCHLLLSSVKNICVRFGKDYKFSLASNGMMAKEKALADLKNCGLTDIQVTFDGQMNSHDEIRRKNKKGYEDLLRIISWLGKSFSLTLKYNIRKQNVGEFTNFIKDIKQLRIPKMIIKLEALQSTLTNADKSFYFSPQDPKLAKVYLDLAKIAIVNKLKVDISSAFKPPCMVSVPNNFMIEPDGDISACVSAYKIANLSLGNIKRIKNPKLLLFDRKEIRKYIFKAMRGKCSLKHCSYFPVCETGCLFVKETLNMSYDVPYCRKAYFDRLIPGLVELKDRSQIT